jgi:hypothetical protein
LAGVALWLFGYLAAGNPSLIDWQANTPSWIASYFPNLESEIGMLVALGGTVLIYLPERYR